MRAAFRAAVGTWLFFLAAPALAQSLPPITSAMIDKGAVACIRVGDDGAVSGAFIAVTSGDASADAAILAWVRQLRWPKDSSEKPREDDWGPMAVGFGVEPPEAPQSCAPPD